MAFRRAAATAARTAARTAATVAVPAVLATVLTVEPALARVSLGGAFAGGLVQPVGILSHLLAFLAIGLWAGQNGGATVWRIPVAVVVAALGAGLAARVGLRLPFAGPGLDASLVVVGALVALALRVPPPLAVLVAAVAAVFHGYAQSGGALFWAGFSAGVLLVTCGGLGLAAVLGPAVSARAVRLCGGVVALVGILDVTRIF